MPPFNAQICKQVRFAPAPFIITYIPPFLSFHLILPLHTFKPTKAYSTAPF